MENIKKIVIVMLMSFISITILCSCNTLSTTEETTEYNITPEDAERQIKNYLSDWQSFKYYVADCCGVLGSVVYREYGPAIYNRSDGLWHVNVEGVAGGSFKGTIKDANVDFYIDVTITTTGDDINICNINGEEVSVNKQNLDDIRR